MATRSPKAGNSYGQGKRKAGATNSKISILQRKQRAMSVGKLMVEHNEECTPGARHRVTD